MTTERKTLQSVFQGDHMSPGFTLTFWSTLGFTLFTVQCIQIACTPVCLPVYIVKSNLAP